MKRDLSLMLIIGLMFLVSLIVAILERSAAVFFAFFIAFLLIFSMNHAIEYHQMHKDSQFKR